MNRITKFFDTFREGKIKLSDDDLDDIFKKEELAKYEYWRNVPKEVLRKIIGKLLRGKPCVLSQDQEDDLLKSLAHHSLCGKVDLDVWKNCLKYWTREDTSKKSAIIVIDVQNDFISGTLALKNLPAKEDGEDVVPVINKLNQNVKFDLKIFSLDWHPSNHCSYHTNVKKYSIHETSKVKAEDAKMYDVVVYSGEALLEQTLWPVHCEQGSWGAKLHADLKVDDSDVLVYKGSIPNVDSYSAFWDNGKLSQTNMFSTLMKNNITQTFMCGLATDFCVLYSSVDSAEHGFQTYLIEDGCKGVAPDSIAAAKEKMKSAGVKIIKADQVASYLK